MLSPEEFRQEYAPSFESGSVIEDRPVNEIGTGNRRVVSRQSGERIGNMHGGNSIL